MNEPDDTTPAIHNEVHVTPVQDEVEHTLDDTCVCGPTTEPVTRDDGSVGWVVTHHSLDGREADEYAEPTPTEETALTSPPPRWVRSANCWAVGDE